MAETGLKAYRIKLRKNPDKKSFGDKKPGDVVYLNEKQARNFADKVEPIDPNWNKKSGGPTIEEFVAAGYKPENYPPEGYAEVPSAKLTQFRAFQKSQTEDATKKDNPFAQPGKPKADDPTGTVAPSVKTGEGNPSVTSEDKTK